MSGTNSIGLPKSSRVIAIRLMRKHTNRLLRRWYQVFELRLNRLRWLCYLTAATNRPAYKPWPDVTAEPVGGLGTCGVVREGASGTRMPVAGSHGWLEATVRAEGSRSRHGPEPRAAKRRNSRAPNDVANPRYSLGPVCVAVCRSEQKNWRSARMAGAPLMDGA